MDQDNTAFDCSILIVSFCCEDPLRRNLARLVSEGVLDADATPRIECIVVDSASGDSTPDMVEREFPQVKLVRSDENIGFARGVNVGMEHATGRTYLLLNPDAEIDKDSLHLLLKTLDADDGIAAVGPRITDLEGHDAPQGQEFPSLGEELRKQWAPLMRLIPGAKKHTGELAKAGPVDWVSGCCLLMRRKTVEELGPLDERYFLYFEETDWCRRTRKAGWTIHYVPEATCFHEGGVSAKTTGEPLLSGQVARYFLDSRHKYFSKNHGWHVAWSVRGVHAVRRLKQRLSGRRAA